MSLWNFFGSFTAVTRPSAGDEREAQANASQLLRLPTEILILIASGLPTSAASCLALCSRRLSQILGPEIWRSLRSEGLSVRLAFLTLLEKDLPRHFLCQKCSSLHQVRAVKWPRILSHQSSPRCTRTSTYSSLCPSRYKMYFHHIQLSMKQQRCSIDLGLPLEAFEHLEIDHNLDKQQMTLLSVDVQSVSNEFVMRSQKWIHVPWSRRSDLINDLATHNLSTMHLCYHTRYERGAGKLLGDLVEPSN